MARTLRLKRGTAAQNAAYTGAVAEVTIDTTKKTLVVHDGATAGGNPIPTLDDVTATISSLIGVPSGIAGLDGDGKVPSAQLPSYVDDVLEYADYAALPATGETGKIYITQDTGASYRWTGTVYIKLSDDDVLEFANLAAFPVSGSGATLYIAADTGFVYRWNGSAYASVGLQPIANQTLLGNVTEWSAVPTALTKGDVQTLLRNSSIVYSPNNSATYVLPAGTSSLHLGDDARNDVTVDCSSLVLGDPPLLISAGASFYGLKITATGYETISATYRVNLLAHQQLLVFKASSAKLYVAFLPSPWIEEVRETGGVHTTRSIRALRVPNESAQGTNVDFAIVPRGNGGFALAIADGTAAGGNKRGTYAVDLQMQRVVAAQVASGADSFIGGGANNTASGSRATVLNGVACTASGSDTLVGGESCAASASYAVSWGYGNSVSGSSGIAIGFGHNIGAVATGAAAFGRSHRLDGRGSSAFGIGARDHSMSGLHLIAGENGGSETGYRQVARSVLRLATVDATTKAITQDGDFITNSNVFKYPNTAQTYVIKARITARKSAATVQVKVWEATIVLGDATGAGDLAILHNTITVLYESAGATGWTIAANLDTANDRFYFNATGAAATAIGWVADVDILFGSSGV